MKSFTCPPARAGGCFRPPKRLFGRTKRDDSKTKRFNEKTTRDAFNLKRFNKTSTRDDFGAKRFNEGTPRDDDGTKRDDKMTAADDFEAKRFDEKTTRDDYNLERFNKTSTRDDFETKSFSERQFPAGTMPARSKNGQHWMISGQDRPSKDGSNHEPHELHEIEINPLPGGFQRFSFPGQSGSDFHNFSFYFPPRRA